MKMISETQDMFYYDDSSSPVNNAAEYEDTQQEDLENNLNVMNQLYKMKKEENLIYPSQYVEKKIMTYLLAVDGSEHAKYAFNLLVNEFLLSNILKVVYISNLTKDYDYNYRNKKEIVTEVFQTLISTNLPTTNADFYTQDLQNQSLHQIELVNRVSDKLTARFLFCGYHGLKGPKSSDKQLSKGIDYLLSECRSPTVLIKENNLRGHKYEICDGYKWLFVFDRALSSCMNLVKIFQPLINNKRDFIYGLTLLPPYINCDDLKKPFISSMTEIGITEEQYEYEAIEYKNDPSAIVINLINYGEVHHFDFVVLYNNPNKYKVERELSDNIKIITKSAANICFVNGIYANL